MRRDVFGVLEGDTLQQFFRVVTPIVLPDGRLVLPLGGAGTIRVFARDFRDLVRDLRAEGRTILLTTHDMAEAEAVCDRVALIDKGRLITVETPHGLSLLLARFERIDFESTDRGLVERVGLLTGVESIDPLPAPNSFRVQLSEESAAGPVLESLVGAGVTSVRTSRPTLEEVYVNIIGGRAAQVGAPSA